MQWLGVDDDEVALPPWMHTVGHEISDLDISRDASQVSFAAPIVPHQCIAYHSTWLHFFFSAPYRTAEIQVRGKQPGVEGPNRTAEDVTSL